MRPLLRTGFAATCCGLALVLAGCPSKTPAPGLDGGVAASVVDAGIAPPVAVFSLQYQSPDAGLATIPLALDEKPLVEPTSVLELRSSVPLRNYRVRLFDESDRAVVSDDRATESETGLEYRIGLPEPLKTGFSYTLVVDAQTGSSLTDAQGHDIDDLRAQFQVAGEKEKPKPSPAPAKSKAKKKKHK
ncbi:hypothetical protein DRW03_26780 [Corallococcus sp. H22C18031201]|uniref:hypothetical protein n=1 Tax=Citreicoccus inhibens TaxID=2849499 RepID=UPI000E7166F3|nr:hypothetical protein [Citreicoccus inhibens]MBU8894751.1 hypothetical protein [Citreicoccus inhibens]RJS17606.1 hypothetical protein DRW03_26780 [Corallococcus sp. H22C18031201]